jgi:5'-deoxynucleotidase YfbR-like HD superfamily hydrolase
VTAFVTPKAWERGDWFVSASGQCFNVREPRPEQISLTDIAHHLSNVCRFGGAVREFYSVAEHCVYVSRLVAPELAPLALIHDAQEAYLGDVIKPLKNCLPDYQALEHIWEAAIAARFGFASLKHPDIKTADVAAVQAERRDLLPSTLNADAPRELWAAYLQRGDRVPPAATPVVPLGSPAAARAAFLARAWELGVR